MRTTTRSSDLVRRANLAPLARIAAALLALGGLTACVSPTPCEEFFRLHPKSPAQKANQTRLFETQSEQELLSASAAVLQDLGFHVSESSREVGFLRAAKERSAREYGQEILRGVIAAISTIGFAGGSNTLIVIPVDFHQQINAALVTRASDESGSRFAVRIMFYRVIWKGSGQSGDTSIPPGEQRMEVIREPEIYQRFFSKLSKAVFLEAHTI